MKYLFITIISLFIAATCMAQPSWRAQRDSLNKLLSTEKEDTLKAITLLDIGWTYMNSSTDSAVQYFMACNELSKKLNFAVGQLRYRFCYTQVLYMQGKRDEQLAIDLETPDIAKQTKQPDGWLISCYSNIANDYVNVNRGDKAMEYYQKALVLSEKLGRKSAWIYSNMTGYYRLLGIRPEVAYQYGLHAISLSRASKKDEDLDVALSHTGHVLIDLKKYDSALLLQQQAQEIAERIDDKLFQTEVLMHINELLIIKQQFEELKANGEKIVALSAATDNMEGIANGKYYIALWHFYKKDYAKAKTYTDSALQISMPHHIDHVSQLAYLLMSDIDLAAADINGYRNARGMSDSLYAVITSADLIKNAQDIEAKYSLEKKQNQINSLNADQKIQKLTLRQTRTAITALIIAIAVLMTVGFLFYRNQQQRKKLLIADADLQKQRITELENEKQLSAAQAVLQGHEEERTRLAKDLHDGLGGILSGVKYSMNNIRSNYIITPEGVAAFDRSMSMLDKSIVELRTVSHNMMPEALMNFGLDTALRDYCNSLNQPGGLQLSYQSFDLDDKTIATTTASVIYRVIQELINNIMKHAQAKNALVQIMRTGNALSITVEDDGIGFNENAGADGIGLKNLRNRVAYLKGTADIVTGSQKGTSVNIEIPDISS